MCRGRLTVLAKVNIPPQVQKQEAPRTGYPDWVGQDARLGKSASLPGPRMRGTGGTLSMVWKCRRDRGHPPIDFTYSFEQLNLFREVYDAGIQNAMHLVRDNSEPKTEESDERFQALGSSYWSGELRHHRNLPLGYPRDFSCGPGSATSQE